MASLIMRSSFCLLRRPTIMSAVRAYSDEPPLLPEPHKGKVVTSQVKMPDPLAHTVGAERFEKLAKLEGIMDPFDVAPVARTKGTKDEPTLIATTLAERMIGCVCEEDAVSIRWMTLHAGEPKRCKCGYWFKLVDAKIPKFLQEEAEKRGMLPT